MRRKPPRAGRLAFALTTGVIAAALATAACEPVRLDNSASPFKSLSLDDVARFRAATCSTQIVEGLRAFPAPQPGAQAAQWLAKSEADRLGVFGKPWSFPKHEGEEPPGAPPFLAAPKDFPQVLTRAFTCAAVARADAALVADPNLARLLAGAAAARQADATGLAGALGTTTPATESVDAATPLALDSEAGKYRQLNAEEKAESEGVRDSGIADTADKDAAGRALASLDAARFRIEEAAAHLPHATKQQVIAVTQTLFAQLEAAVAAGAPDLRQVTYPLREGEPAARAHAAIEAALAAEYRLLGAPNLKVREDAARAVIVLTAVGRSWGMLAQPFPGLNPQGEPTPFPTDPPASTETAETARQ